MNDLAMTCKFFSFQEIHLEEGKPRSGHGSTGYLL
jgi:hypothetical protein